MDDDSALNDFLSRFGDPENKRETVKPVSDLKPAGFSRSITEGLNIPVNNIAKQGLTSIATNSEISSPDISESLNNKMSSIPSAEKKDLAGDIKGGLTDVLSAAPSAMSLINNAKGGQFDTSADGGGPGKAGGAIMQGAGDGMQFASAIGLKDPLSQGIAALGGGLISTFAHKGAMKDWRKNQVKANLSENALEKAKRKEEYAMSEGLESMENLKSLRKKQLGIIG